MSSDLAQTMKATTEAFLFAFNGSWSAETNKTTISLRAPECEHTMVPSSLDMPSKSNDQFSAYFRSLEGVVTNAKMEIHDYVANVGERRVVAHSSLTATTPFGPFKNEYIWFFAFDETGEKITSIKEFLDSQATKDLKAKLANAAR